MVEKPLSTKEKQRIRFRIPGSRSKKNEALRNSVAFAYFARADSEMITESKETVEEKKNGNQSQNFRPTSFHRGSMLLPSFSPPPTQSNCSSRNSLTTRSEPKKRAVDEVSRDTATVPVEQHLPEKNLSKNETDSQIKKPSNSSLRSLK